jgi:hypothetical protein
MFLGKLKIRSKRLLSEKVMVMEKIDFKKLMKQLYNPPTKAVSIVEAKRQNFICIDGTGDPSKDDFFRKASDALVRLSYTIKFLLKDGGMGPDYIAMPLEAVWWNDDETEFRYDDLDNCYWRLCILQPYFVTEQHIEIGLERAKKKKGICIPCLEKVLFMPIEEGLSTQLVHIGPYETKGDTIDKLRAYIDVNGYMYNGKHHEIYIGDPRRAKPENLKTIIRQPVKK